jgi:tetratricopeptide (TPR) repeat protein
MKIVRPLLAMFASMLLTNSLAAATPTDLKKMSDADLVAFYKTVLQAEKPDYCGAWAPVIAEMMRRPSIQADLQRQQTYVDFRCALVEEKWTTAYRLMGEVERDSDSDFGSFGFSVAMISGHPENAAQRLTKLAAAKDGTDFLSINDESIFQLLRDLWIGKHFAVRDNVVQTLLGSRNANKLSANLKSGLAGAIIGEEGRTGKFKRTARLLDKIDSPYQFIGFLSMKTFQPAWPDIEKAAGPNLATVLNRSSESVLARYRKDPSNREAFQQVAHSLLFAGKFEEVIAHVASFDHSAAGIAKATEHDAWALNVEAYALDALGRPAEAETIFNHIAAIPYKPEENGWLVNFTINRGSRLVELGQWEKGLEAATLAGQVTEKSGSPYAKMLVRRDKICALQNLGRGAETKAMVEEAYEMRKNAHSAAASALLCVGDVERAAAIVIEALSDPVQAETMATELQQPQFQLFYTRSKLTTLREGLLPRTDVRNAFATVARDIPDSFIPLAGKRRMAMELAR